MRSYGVLFVLDACIQSLRPSALQLSVNMLYLFAPVDYCIKPIEAIINKYNYYVYVCAITWYLSQCSTFSYLMYSIILLVITFKPHNCRRGKEVALD